MAKKDNHVIIAYFPGADKADMAANQLKAWDKATDAIKLGGIGMPRTGFDWHTRNEPIGSEELAESKAPFMNYCIEQFGPDRSMFESNFPVDKVSYSYNIMYNAFKRLSKDYSASERAAMFHDNATRVYRVNI